MKRQLSEAELAQRRAAAPKGAKAFHAKYDGTIQQGLWCALGYYELCNKYGYEIANTIAFGKHTPTAEYLRENGGRRPQKEYKNG